MSIRVGPEWVTVAQTIYTSRETSRTKEPEYRFATRGTARSQLQSLAKSEPGVWTTQLGFRSTERHGADATQSNEYAYTMTTYTQAFDGSQHSSFDTSSHGVTQTRRRKSCAGQRPTPATRIFIFASPRVGSVGHEQPDTIRPGEAQTRRCAVRVGAGSGRWGCAHPHPPSHQTGVSGGGWETPLTPDWCEGSAPGGGCHV